MGKLWLLVATGIAYGSLFPFEFVRPYPDEGLLSHLIRNALLRPSRGDVLANLILYLPFGFMGVWALPRRISGARAIVIVVALGILLSASIELAQAFTSGRTSSALDLALNLLSTAIGAVSARFTGGSNRQLLVQARHRFHDTFAAILAASWVAYRLVPFVPTIDFQHIKDAMRPLLTLSGFSAWACTRHFICWLAFAYLLRVATSPSLSRLALPIIGLAVVIAPLGIVGRVMRPEEIVSVMTASLLWPFLARSRMTRPVLLVLVIAVVIGIELAPFDFSGNYRDFAWLPFSGFITGAMEVGVFAIFEKFFLYGTLIWLLARSGMPLLPGTILVALAMLGLEFCQLLTPDRSPEITDALMALIAGWMCAVFSPKSEQHVAPPRHPGPERAAAARQRGE